MDSTIVVGADIELGNCWTTPHGSRSNLEAASRVLQSLGRLRPFHGFCGSAWGSTQGEWGRQWLKNGSCIYCDMSHVECATQEVASARDHAAAVHAAVRIVRSARRRALAALPPRDDLFVNVHTSDGTPETSWGAHLNFMIPRRLWNAVFHHHKPHLMAMLASFMAAAVPVFGQGLVLRSADGCRYMTSARAHHLGSLVTLATTEAFNRGLLNSRDEPHADGEWARLHLIAFDANLQPAAIFMRTGLAQLFLAALDTGWFNPDLLLDDPVAAAFAWSAGFDLESGRFSPAARRPGRSSIELTDWHQTLARDLDQLLTAGLIPESVVPEGAAILQMWTETLDGLARGDMPLVAARLDWALKWQTLALLPGWQGDLGDPRLRLLDQYYGHVDDRVGLFWDSWRRGAVDRVIGDETIRHFMFAGDLHTRSGLRAELVRRLGPWIWSMDWDHVEVAAADRSWPWRTHRRRIALADPAASSAELIAELRDRFPDDRSLLNHVLEDDHEQSVHSIVN
jgi:proteasome accessory factor A